MAFTDEDNAMSMSQPKRRYPIGAELVGDNQTHFRVWAPKAQQLNVVFEKGTEVPLSAEPHGYFSGTADVGPGTRYGFCINGATETIPIRPRVFNPMDRTDPRASSIPQNSNGRTRNGVDRN